MKIIVTFTINISLIITIIIMVIKVMKMTEKIKVENI